MLRHNHLWICIFKKLSLPSYHYVSLHSCLNKMHLSAGETLYFWNQFRMFLTLCRCLASCLILWLTGVSCPPGGSEPARCGLPPVLTPRFNPKQSSSIIQDSTNTQTNTCVGAFREGLHVTRFYFKRQRESVFKTKQSMQAEVMLLWAADWWPTSNKLVTSLLFHDSEISLPRRVA